MDQDASFHGSGGGSPLHDSLQDLARSTMADNDWSMSCPQLRSRLSNSTRELWCFGGAESAGTDKEKRLILPNATAALAIRSINAAAYLCLSHALPGRHVGWNEDGTVLEFAVEFLCVAFRKLAHDVVFAALRLPVGRAPNSSLLDSMSDQVTATKIHTPSMPFDALAVVLENGNGRKPLSLDSHILDQQEQNQAPPRRWYESKVRRNAFIALSWSLQSAEFVQKYSSSLVPLPPSGVDATLGVKMGIGLGESSGVVESIAHCALEFLLYGDKLQRVHPRLQNKEFTLSYNESDLPREKRSDETQSEHESLFSASISLLCVLLRTGLADWLHFADSTNSEGSPGKEGTTESFLHQLCRTLLLHTHQLSDDSLSTQGYQCAMQSLSLLALIQWKVGIPKINDVVHGENSGNLNEGVLFNSSAVEYVFKVAFTKVAFAHRSDESNWNQMGPRWIRQPAMCLVKDAVQILCDVTLIGGEALSLLKSSQDLVPHLKQCWESIVWLDRQGTDFHCFAIEHAIDCLVILHRSCRKITRRALIDVLSSNHDADHGNEDQMEPMCMDILLSLCMHGNICIASKCGALLKSLLQDRPEANGNDELARRLWSSLEQNEKALYGLLTHALKLSPDPPQSFLDTSLSEVRLCCVLDVIAVICESTRCCSNLLLTASHEKQLQLLISSLGGILSPDMSSGTEESDKCLIHEGDGHSILRRTDPGQMSDCLRSANKLSAAFILARLVNTNQIACIEEHGSLTLRNASARSLLRDFVSSQEGNGHVLQFSVVQASSRDLTWRALRLIAVLVSSSQENEHFLSSSLFTYCGEMNHQLVEEKERSNELQSQLSATTATADSLKKERNLLRRKLELQGLAAKMELSRIQNDAKAEAMETVEVHAEERAKAERDAACCKEAQARAEQKRSVAEAQAEKAQQSMELLRAELASCNNRARDLQTLVKQNEATIKDHEKASYRMSQDLMSAREQMQLLTKKQEGTEQRLSSTEHTLRETQSAFKGLQANTENSYSKLVALAQLYQVKEKELSSTRAEFRETVQKANADADAAANRYEAVKENEQTLHKENKELKKKLEKLMRRLEKEEKERHRLEMEMKARRGPVSYINNLIDESNDRSIREKKKGKERTRRSGKENGVVHSQSRRGLDVSGWGRVQHSSR